MTKEERLKSLERAEEKCYAHLDALSKEEVPQNSTMILLSTIDELRFMMNRVNREGETFTLSKDGAFQFRVDKPVIEPVGRSLLETNPAKTAAEDTDLVETATEEPEAVATEVSAKTYSRDEVKVTLNRLHREGKIDVAELFEQIGYTKMSDIPDSELGKLMALAGVE